MHDFVWLDFFEQCFGVEIPNLSAWRRATCGDLTATLAFGEPPRLDVPVLPETSGALARVEREIMTLPAPAVPARQAMPVQESGARKRRGMPLA